MDAIQLHCLMRVLWLLITLQWWGVSLGANILFLHPLYSGSHEFALRGLAEVLVSKGHNVTYVKFRNTEELHSSNLTELTLSVDNRGGHHPYISREERGRFSLPLKLLWEHGHNPLMHLKDAFRTMKPLCDALLGDRSLESRLRASNFDVAVVDLFTNECGLALVHHLGVPAIGYWALPLNGGEGSFAVGLGLTANPSVWPSFMSGLTNDMSYFQRVYNWLLWLVGSLVMEVQFHITGSLIRNHLPGTPSPMELLQDLAGLLVNSDWSINYLRPLPPNAANVGCMQCRTSRNLTQELDTWMWDAGVAGVILFSMGASFDTSVLPHTTIEHLLGAFSRLPQRVLLRVQGILPRKLPKNIRIMHWLPQQDVLGHPQTRAFFTHCGMHGAMETVYHGVPVVGMPIFGDQFDVVEMLQAKGMALRIDKDSSEDEIHDALTQVVNDPRYRRATLKTRSLLKDQPQSPLERAVWMVEYVARHRGAPHLKLPSRTFGVLQRNGLDVLLVLFLFPLLLLYVVWRLTTIIANFIVELHQAHVKKMA